MSSPVFVPPISAQFGTIIQDRYNAAKAEAAKLSEGKTTVKIEYLKPVHLNLSSYALPTGDTTDRLEDTCALFPAGILNPDANFDYMKWWRGTKTEYVADWFVLPIYYMAEYKQGAYAGNLKKYEFREGETFTFNCHNIGGAGYATVSGWLIAFVCFPETLEETKIIH